MDMAAEVPTGSRLHAFVSGRVQGVCFRDFTARAAREIGLAGVVRNLPDGRVEVVAEGARDRLDELVARLGQGPPGSSVTDVSVTWEESKAEYTGFRIVYH